MYYLATNFCFSFSTILLATFPLLVGVITIILAAVGGGFWYLNQQKQLKATRQKAVNTLKQLQHQLSGLNEALGYLNKHPEVINIEDNMHASDVVQVISEYLNFTEANILGDPNIGKAPMTKQEAQEFIARIKNNIGTIAPLAKNNQMLVEGIKILDVLEEKKEVYTKQLPDFEQRIQALVTSNTNWWHAQNSFTSYADLGQLSIELDNGIAKGWEFLKQNGSTEAEAQGIQKINKTLDKICLQIEQIMYEVTQLETTIIQYHQRLKQDPQSVQVLTKEINDWHAQYTYINKQVAIDKAQNDVQQAQQLAKDTKKDWASIIQYLDQALASVQQAKDYFVKFDQARQHYEHKLSHTIATQHQAIEQWMQQADYVNLPSLAQCQQHIEIAQNGLDSLLAKAPTVDWLMVDETAQELAKEQAGLLKEFEAYKAAHQRFTQLETEIQRLHQTIEPLEQTVVMRVHEMLPAIDQKQVDLTKAQGWFEKANAANALVKALDAYVHDLKGRQELLYQIADQANNALAEAQKLLDNPQMKGKHRALIEDLSVPPMSQTEFGQLMGAFDQAIRNILEAQTQVQIGLIAQEEEQQHLTHLTDECKQAIERVQALQSYADEALLGAIQLLEVPDIEHYRYDEAIAELEVVRRKAVDLHRQVQDVMSRQ